MSDMGSYIEIPTLSRSDIEKLAVTLLSVMKSDSREERGAGDSVSVKIDLDSIASSVAGLIEPIGQLKIFLTEYYRAFAIWTVDTLTSVIGRTSEDIKNFFRPIFDAVQSNLREIRDIIINNLMKIVAGLYDVIKTVRDAIVEILLRLIDKISEITNELIQRIERVDRYLEKVRETIEDLTRSVSRTLRTLTETVISTIIDTILTLQELMLSCFRAVLEAISGVITELYNVSRETIKDLTEAVNRAIEKIGEMLDKALDRISRFAENILENLKEMLSTMKEIVAPLLKAISGTVGKIEIRVENLPAEVVINVGKIVQTAVNTIIEGLQEITRLSKELVDIIISSIREAIRPILEMVKNMVQRIGDFFTTILDYTKEVFLSLAETMKRLFSELKDITIRGFEGISKIVKDVTKTVSDIMTRTADIMIDKVEKRISEILEAFASKQAKSLQETVDRRIIDPIRKYIETVLTSKLENIEKELSRGTSSILPYLEKIVSNLETIKNLLKPPEKETIEKEIKEEGMVLLAPIMVRPPKVIEIGPLMPIPATPEEFYRLRRRRPTEIEILEREWRRKIEEAIIRGVEREIVKGVEKPAAPPGPDPFTLIANALQRIREVFENIVQIFTNPGKLIETFVNALKGAMETFKDVIKEAFKRIAEIFVWIQQGLAGLLEIFVDEVKKGLEGTIKFLGGVFGKLVEALTAERSPSLMQILFSSLGPHILTLISVALFWGWKYFLPKFKEFIEKEFESPVSFLYAVVNLSIVALLGVEFTKRVVRAFIDSLPEGRMSLRPFGLGIVFLVDIKKFVSNLWSLIERSLPDVARYMLIGHLIWWAEPTRAITRYWLSNWLTIELPPMEDTLSALRRHLAAPGLYTYYEIFVRQLRMGGIYRGFISGLYPLSDKLVADIERVVGDITKIYDKDRGAVIVGDRFSPFTGKYRAFPVSLIWQLPSPSELARMMVRDILENPKDFAIAMAMHGYHPDIAFLYYLLHYRYPSPEKLAEFFWRGIAGELWLSEITIDKNVMKTFGLDPEKVVAVPPAALNFRAGVLLDMISWYMKWHDYARFPWRPGWTTDNAIVIELMADIPTKIDLRWMTRWGMFDYWSAHGITLAHTIGSITKNLVAAERTCAAKPLVEAYLKMLRSGEIVFDLRQFCRVLQATGIHPYWIPWVAIAESINALTEERTLLRTGFINLYKEGIWSIDNLHQLLSGFFTVKFRVGYFDVDKKQWVSSTVEYPVAFLPAESKLLELRAVMDRALDIYREAYRYVIRAVAYNLIEPRIGKQLLEYIVRAINVGFFSDTIRSLTGRELSLTLDEGYWSAWSVYAETVRHIEAIERTRFYARYIIWSVLWALRLGYTTYKDAEKYIEQLVNIMHEHTLVHDAIRLAVNFMIMRFEREIAVRAVINLVRSRRLSMPEAIQMLKAMGFDEDTARRYIEANVLWYTPSLTTYGTLLEIVPEALNMSLKAIEHFNLPSDEIYYWRLYIFRRAVWDELTLVRTRIYRVLRRGVKPENLVDILRSYAVLPSFKDGKLEVRYGEIAAKLAEFYKKHSAVFQAFGISVHEWILYNLIAYLENLSETMERYIPTPSMLATLAEYIVIPGKLIEQALRIRGVPEEWVDLWARYIAIRPLADDVRGLLTSYRRAKVLGVLPQELESKILEVAKAVGWTENELRILELRVLVEELIESSRQYIPTPMMLATLSEYIKLPDDLILEALRARKVPSRWIEFWRWYISIRPLADDVKQLLTAYRRAKVLGVLPENIEKAVLAIAKQVGYGDWELGILELRVTIEELIQSSRQYIPTPMMLASLCEYIKIPDEYIDEALKARRVPEKWFAFWKRYIAIRPIADDVRRLLTAYRRAKVLGVIPPELEKQVLELAKAVGFTENELMILELRVLVEELIESSRQYIPTPTMLATISEYVKIPEELIDKALTARKVPGEWVPLWKSYISIRPLADDIRSLLVAYRRAKALGVLPPDLESEIRALATRVGWTERELRILDLRIALEELINRARGYVPTPYMLATLSEYLPEARKFIDDVLRRRNVPEQYWGLWRKFVEIRPVINDVRRLVRAAERLYVYFFLKPEDYRKLLEKVRVLGFEDREIELMISASEMVRAYRAFRELIGTPRQLVTMAEYSPRARRLALGQVKKMIDVLPIDQETKEFLKAMWDEFIRVRPVYNEVRRYVTELISDYAEGLIDMSYLKRELEELKEWGLDDAEISFYIKLAEKRRARYQLREMKRMMRR